MAFLDRITVDPALCEGNPCLRGMPITVGSVLTRLREGVSESELLMEYPALVSDDIRACLEYQALQLPSLGRHSSVEDGSQILDSAINSLFSSATDSLSW